MFKGLILYKRRVLILYKRQGLILYKRQGLYEYHPPLYAQMVVIGLLFGVGGGQKLLRFIPPSRVIEEIEPNAQILVVCIDTACAFVLSGSPIVLALSLAHV